MGDKTWGSYYNPELHMSSQEYHHCSLPHIKKIKEKRSSWKLMSVFWDMKGVVHWEFTPPRTTINLNQDFVTMEDLKQPVRSTRITFLLQRDNTWPHTSVKTCAYLAVLGFKVLIYPPYSPDLAPSNFFCSDIWRNSWKELDLPRMTLWRLQYWHG